MIRALILSALLSLACARLAVAQSPPRDVVVRAGTAVIRGRVVEAGTSQPVHKVRIHANSPALKDGRSAYTDANGAFELTALPAGRYTVTAGKVGFVPAAHGQPRPMELGTAIDVADGQIVAPVDFAMSRAGVIAGVITDEFGEPLANTTVSAMRYQTANGQRRLVPASVRQTNDIGEFRLFSLIPGQYYVTATYQDPMAGATPNQDGVYAPTYYPGTASVAAAQPIAIAAGQTQTGMNLMLLPVRPVRVSGTVVDSTGKPPVGAPVQSFAREGLRAPVGYAAVRSDGTFVLEKMTAGDYTLRVGSMAGIMVTSGSGNVRPGGGETAALPLTVGSGDISDVHIVTSPPISVIGHVHVDPAELGTLKGSTFRLTTPASTPAEAGLGANPPTAVHDDFTFELKIPPGHVFIRSNTPGWFLRSVRFNGAEILDTGVEIRPNTSITGVEIELTHKQPELSGVARTAAGEPTRTAYVILFPQDRTHWGYLSRYVRLGRPNPDNQFRILVPPGEYLAVALDYVPPGEDISDPAFLEPLRDRATPISLRDGDHKTLDLAVTSASPQ
jgi:Carboxypeptidase regulatory-like domain